MFSRLKVPVKADVNLNESSGRQMVPDIPWISSVIFFGKMSVFSFVLIPMVRYERDFRSTLPFASSRFRMAIPFFSVLNPRI